MLGMKYMAKIKFTLISICLLLVIVSCQKDEIIIYKQLSGVSFFSNSSKANYTYSFVENPGKSMDTINVPVIISGSAFDVDREVIAVAITDSVTTANVEHYEILKGNVPAGEIQGLIPVILKKAAHHDTIIDTLRIKINSNIDFPLTELGITYCDIEFTSKIIQPANWWILKYYFGPFSTRWWKFIMEVTGRTSLPYNGYNNVSEEWPMTYTEIGAYKQIVKAALIKYNKEHQSEPLKHDDGENEGAVVEMPS